MRKHVVSLSRTAPRKQHGGFEFIPLSGCQNNDLLSNQAGTLSIQFDQSQCKTGLMLRQLRVLSILPFRFSCSRRDLVLENLALRQQLTVLKRRIPRNSTIVSRGMPANLPPKLSPSTTPLIKPDRPLPFCHDGRRRHRGAPASI
jgi:hypothetical protein